MEAPYILISTISPEKDKKIDAFDKHTKIAFLYRHCMELGLKAIGFQFI